jgi:hypothetical protein
MLAQTIKPQHHRPQGKDDVGFNDSRNQAGHIPQCLPDIHRATYQQVNQAGLEKNVYEKAVSFG